MPVEVNINVLALHKLVDYVASGIGSVAGSMLAPWKARQEAKAKQIEVEAKANSMRILADAQSDARKALISQDSPIIGELNIADSVSQRIQFQEAKRQANIEAVVRQAAEQLGDTTVEDIEPDHDWTARFFNDVQDVSSEEMQSLWTKVLAGEVERSGSTSIRTLGILKGLDQSTALLFQKFCSVCIFFRPDMKTLIDARVPSLGGIPAQNCLKKYGLDFNALNRLHEHGLIISDYNSWFDYQLSIGSVSNEKSHMVCIPFQFQNRFWLLPSINNPAQSKEFRLTGVALNQSGKELSKFIELQTIDEFSKELGNFLKGQNLLMTEIENDKPVIIPITK